MEIKIPEKEPSPNGQTKKFLKKEPSPNGQQNLTKKILLFL